MGLKQIDFDVVQVIRNTDDPEEGVILRFPEEDREVILTAHQWNHVVEAVIMIKAVNDYYKGSEDSIKVNFSELPNPFDGILGDN